MFNHAQNAIPVRPNLAAQAPLAAQQNEQAHSASNSPVHSIASALLEGSLNSDTVYSLSSYSHIDEFSVNHLDVMSAFSTPSSTEQSSEAPTVTQQQGLHSPSITYHAPDNHQLIRQALRSDLRKWCLSAPPAEARQRTQMAIDIASCFHRQNPNLVLRGDQVTELPSCLGLLQHVRSFSVEGCASLKEIPNILHNMPNLGLLNVKDCTQLTCLPASAISSDWAVRIYLNNSGVDLRNPLGASSKNS